MQYAFYFDQSRCIGCNACTVACKDYNQVNPGLVRWRKQETYEKQPVGRAFQSFVMSCNHCDEPACKAACPVQAIVKRDDGIVIVDRKICQGLRSCILACPFAAPHIAGDKQEPIKKSEWKIQHPMQKCHMCWERLDRGEKPACVGACPVHALDCDDKDMIEIKYPTAVKLNKTNFPYAYTAGEFKETGPNLYVKSASTALKISSYQK